MFGGRLDDWFGGRLETMREAVARHGHAADWARALGALPAVAGVRRVPGDAVTLRAAGALPGAASAALADALGVLHPWRKGPFDFFGIAVDAEWRSDWKWARVAPHLEPLAGRRVLDVGCGNGYYAWRMLDAGAAVVVGLDPAPLCLAQFEAVRRYVPRAPAAVLPLGSAALARPLAAFDTVFSMGVLYHRRDPARHLEELRRAMSPGGELVLETLVLDRHGEALLEPAGRYARMRNVHAIPAPAVVERWLREAGFLVPRCVDLCVTTTAEQRSTPWMRFQSLAECLDAEDPALTVEGLPAPRRGIFIARAP
ncbi:MAG: tRNA 5-methoxyuridine(34)/uridine 5-oxyacetic acid(34) synthase CmoB [Gammaproteobacteria bacterium]